jgi:hypothetical protein
VSVKTIFGKLNALPVALMLNDNNWIFGVMCHVWPFFTKRIDSGDVKNHPSFRHPPLPGLNLNSIHNTLNRLHANLLWQNKTPRYSGTKREA